MSKASSQIMDDIRAMFGPRPDAGASDANLVTRAALKDCTRCGNALPISGPHRCPDARIVPREGKPGFDVYLAERGSFP